MMISDCDATMKELGHAFGVAKMDDNRVTAYYNAFKHLTDQQFAALSEWAKQNCDRFPTIKELYRGVYDCGMVQRPKLSDLDKDTMTVVCECGCSFVFPRTAPPATYHCMGDGCHVSYESEYVIQNADRYGVLWADVEIRMALNGRIPKAHAMKAVYEFLSAMHKDVEAQLPKKKTLKEIRAIEKPKTPAPEAMFAKSFDGTDPRPSPVA